MTTLYFALFLQAGTAPIAKDISTMANASQDQTMLIYVLIVAYGPLLTVIGILWRKWEASRTEIKEAAIKREAMIQEHHRQIQALSTEKNNMNERLGMILAKLEHK